MKRRLFTIFSAVSLLLFVAVVVLWVRSYWVAEGVRWYRPDVAGARWAGDSIVSTKGRVLISGTRVEFTWPEYASQFAGSVTSGGVGGLSYVAMEPYWYLRRDASVWERMGFGVEPYDGARSLVEVRREQFGAYAPHWAFALATSALPAMWLWWRRAGVRRLRRGLCPACGYDVRATPGRCPECGTSLGEAGT